MAITPAPVPMYFSALRRFILLWGSGVDKESLFARISVAMK